MKKRKFPATNEAWSDFCEIEHNADRFAYSGPPAVVTFEADYQACKKDAEAGEQRAIDLMAKFVKFRMKS